MATTVFPKYPIYIISKGRADSRYTSKALEEMGVPYRIVVEKHEYDTYCSVIDPKKVLMLPWSNHGMGSGPARNWVWDHSMSEGHEKHWIMDDNIRNFRRLYKSTRLRMRTGNFFRACEDFIDRYENVWMSGLQYKFFCAPTEKYAPFIVNTRIMSCILMDNSCPHRWRAKYNEDVDLSLRILKDGACTILIYAFLQDKISTQILKGGNTEELYGSGTFEKSKMLVDLHPDCVSLVKRYGRWHHQVDMSRFRNNELKLKKGIIIPTENNEYNISLKKYEKNGSDRFIPLIDIDYWRNEKL